MTRDPVSGIRVLGRTIDYSDGSEDRLIEILSETMDLSSLSDELATRIVDWPTRYHLARERSNLLRPLRLGPGHRVLEIGAGTGAISRYLGETGARVVALEGALPRARAAALRCKDLDNVAVVCGSLDVYDDPEGFDLVLLIGVLEYAGSGPTGVDPPAFVGRAARNLRPGGSLVVAIENQIGLKYLLGYDEDHLGRPWAGLEGYPAGGGVRTFSRRRLAALLESSGLERQRWLYPYPDYKLPSTIIPDGVFNEPDAAGFVDRLVGDPVAGHDSDAAVLADRRAVHRTFLEAGLGREIASSFLVLASSGEPGHDADPDPGTLAWLFGKPRRQVWIRHQVVESGATGRRIRWAGPSILDRPRAVSWLRQMPAKDDSFVVGATVHELAAAACRARDAEALAEILGRWRQTIDAHRTAAVPTETQHPYLLPSTRHVLPPDYLDLSLANFIVSGDELVFIDREWIAEPGIDADLAMVRALWLLAQRIVVEGGIHPWDPALGVDEVTAGLGGLLDLPVDAVIEPLYEAEPELLHLVTGRDRGEIRKDLAWLRSFRPTGAEALSSAPISRLRDRLDLLEDEIDRARAECGSARGERDRERAERGRLESEVEHERTVVARLTEELSATHERLAAIGKDLETWMADAAALRDSLAESEARRSELDQRLAEVEAEAEMLRQWRQAFEDRLPVRILRRFQR